MNFKNNTIIKCDLTHGFKFIKGIEKYNLILVDDIEVLINYKDEIKELLCDNCGLIIYTDKLLTESDIDYLNMNLIVQKNINNKHLYFYGHNMIYNYYYDKEISFINNEIIKLSISDKTEFERKDNIINLFNKDNVLNYNINKFLNKGYTANETINTLDLTKGEDLSQLLIINNDCKLTILGYDKIKVRTTSALHGRKINFIEIN